MKSRSLIFVTLACAMFAVAGFFLAWRVRATASDTETRQSRLTAQNALLKERLCALNAQYNAAIDAASVLEKTNDSKNTLTEHKDALEIISRYDAASALALKREKTTEFQKKLFAARRVDLGIIYGPFFYMAGLTPDQAAKLTDAVLQRNETKRDINIVREEKHGNPDDPVWDELRNEANDKAQAVAHSILGDDGHAQFQLYERQIDAWTYAENFAAGMALADMPVSFEQSQKLVEAVTNASASYRNGTAEMGLLNDVDWSAVDAEMQKILTPGQFEFFTTTAFRLGATSDNVGVISRWDAEYSKAFAAARKSYTK